MTPVPDRGPTFTIQANRSWTLNIRSQNATTWTYVGTAGGVKPIGDLAWSTASGGAFAAITNADAIFTAGASATSGTPAQAFFRTSWAGGYGSPGNAPGTYSLPVIFTLSAPYSMRSASRSPSLAGAESRGRRRGLWSPTSVSNAFFRTAYSWTLDTPGVYSLVVIFTLTAP